MLRALVMTTVLLTAGVAPAAGQTVGLGLGDRIRIHGGILSGTHTVLAAAGDTLTLLRDGRRTTASVVLSDVRRMDVSLGRRSAGSGALRGAGWGVLIGVPFGVIGGLLEGDDDTSWLAWSAEEKALMYGVAYGFTGALVGSIIGLAAPGERWQRIEPARVTVAPSRDGGLALTLRRSF